MGSFLQGMNVDLDLYELAGGALHSSHGNDKGSFSVFPRFDIEKTT